MGHFGGCFPLWIWTNSLWLWCPLPLPACSDIQGRSRAAHIAFMQLQIFWLEHNLDLGHFDNMIFLSFQSPLRLSSPHPLFPFSRLHSIARCLLQTGGFVGVVNVGAQSSQYWLSISWIVELNHACQSSVSDFCATIVFVFPRMITLILCVSDLHK